MTEKATWTLRQADGAVWLEGGDQQAQDAIVFLHAFPVGVWVWEGQRIPAGWRAIAPAMPGFDGTAPPSGTSSSIDDYAGSVIALMNHLAIRSAVLVGLSMGGYVAFALWRQAADRCRGLILADTKSGADAADVRAGREKMLALVGSRGAAAVAEAMIPKLLAARTRVEQPDVMSRVRELIAAQSAEGIAAAIVRLRDRPDSTALLAGITVPALVIVGEDDELTPPAEAERLQAGLVNCGLERIVGAGHLSNMETPAIFDAALERFLRTIPR